MGGAASAGRFERWWFVKELRIMCKSLGIWNRDGLEEMLRRVLWQDKWCGEHVRCLWNDIVMMEDTEARSLSPYSPGLDIQQLVEGSC